MFSKLLFIWCYREGARTFGRSSTVFASRGTVGVGYLEPVGAPVVHPPPFRLYKISTASGTDPTSDYFEVGHEDSVASERARVSGRLEFPFVRVAFTTDARRQSVPPSPLAPSSSSGPVPPHGSLRLSFPLKRPYDYFECKDAGEISGHGRKHQKRPSPTGSQHSRSLGCLGPREGRLWSRCSRVARTSRLTQLQKSPKDNRLVGRLVKKIRQQVGREMCRLVRGTNSETVPCMRDESSLSTKLRPLSPVFILR